ncbi:MAG: protein phosphatase CheZ [Thiomicrorhabdus sp.]|nr:protein phosphatase CheZ [Thiomicrorhabdus sp.]
MKDASQIDIHQAKALVAAFEEDDQKKVLEIIDEMTQIRESELFQQLNSLTENLHLTLDNIDDNALFMQTKHDIPDATERLEYVLQTTEQASTQTLDTAEQALQHLESIQNVLNTELDSDKLASIQPEMNKISESLTNIMLAQSYQDLTGQVLNRVIFVISSLEQSLIQLIESSGHDYHAIPDRVLSEEEQRAKEMHGMGPNVTQATKKDIVESQDDIDSLLSDLGI